MEHILTFKGSQPPVDRFSSFVSTEATPRDVHEDDDVTFLAGHVGQPVHPPLARHLLTPGTDVSAGIVNMFTVLIIFSQCKTDSYLDIALRKGSIQKMKVKEHS